MAERLLRLLRIVMANSRRRLEGRSIERCKGRHRAIAQLRDTSEFQEQRSTEEKRTQLAADTAVGDKVVDLQNEDPGTIEHLMIDPEMGRIAYAVLSFGCFSGWATSYLPSRGDPRPRHDRS